MDLRNNEALTPIQSGFPITAITLDLSNACNLACEYCNPAGTPILMADLTYKPIEKIEMGDLVLGFAKDEKRYGQQAFRISQVEGTGKRLSELIRVTTTEGIFVCTPDHKWFNGCSYQPARIGMKIGFLSSPRYFKENDEYQFGYIHGVFAGDGCFSEGLHVIKSRPTQGRETQYNHVQLAMKDREPIDRVQRYLHELGRDQLNEFDFEVRDDEIYMHGLRTGQRGAFEFLLGAPDENSTFDYVRGWLAGIFDAEGSHDGYNLRIYQSLHQHPETCKAISLSLDRLGFRFSMNEYGDHGVLTFTLLGGMKTQVLFFSTCHPAISRKLVSVYENKHIPVYAKVLDIEPILARRELVYGLQTTTGNYIAHGHTSKNCFAHCFDADYEKSHLSMDMAQKAVDWLMDPGTRGDARKVDITFWGGEPLLRWAVLQETVLYAERKAQEYGIEVTFGGTTNVTLLTPEKFDFLEIHNIHFLLSCDGIQTHHDKFRRHADGRGSWEQVDRNLTDIIARWPMSEIRLSFTAENLEGFIEDMDYFFTKGFRAIVYSPVSEGDWTEERLAKLHEAWADTARWFVEHWQQDERLSIKFIKDACTQLNGQPVGDAAPCGAGRGYCGIAVDGSIWNCHRFHKMDDERPWYEKETCLGHIEIGILNQEWRKPFMEWIPFRDCSDGCHDCRAFRVSCTGGCWATNWDLNGDISYPPRVNCETSLAALEQADIVTEMLGKKYLDTILPHQHATSALPEVQGCQCFNVQDNLYGRYRMNKTEPYACLCNMSTYGTAPKPIRSCTCYNVENQGRGLFDPSGTNCSQYTSPAVLDDARTYLSTLQEHLDELDPATLDHVESFLDSLGGFRT